jgi:hypothetical protein
LPVRFVTAVLTDEKCKLESIDGEIVVLRHESEVYRVKVSEKGTHTAESNPSAVRVPIA